jgi:hypothetical protein
VRKTKWAPLSVCTTPLSSPTCCEQRATLKFIENERQDTFKLLTAFSNGACICPGPNSPRSPAIRKDLSKSDQLQSLCYTCKGILKWECARTSLGRRATVRLLASQILQADLPAYDASHQIKFDQSQIQSYDMKNFTNYNRCLKNISPTSYEPSAEAIQNFNSLLSCSCTNLNATCALANMRIMANPSTSFQLEQRRDSSCLTRRWEAIT